MKDINLKLIISKSYLGADKKICGVSLGITGQPLFSV